MRTTLLLIPVLLTGLGRAYAQDTTRVGTYSRELQVYFDNDYIYFEDYYYTAGLQIAYRRLVNAGSKWPGRLVRHDSMKVILSYQAGVKIFNPFDIETHSVSRMDRPYAGWSFVGAGLSMFNAGHWGQHVELETGMVGPASGMEQLQRWVHKILDYDLPAGWTYQIRNEWVVNASYSVLGNWRLAEDADIITQSSVQAGTGSNKISQDVTLRLIQFNPINNSAYTNSRLSRDREQKKSETEIFIFAEGGVDYVMSDIFLEGSLFHNHRSNFEVKAEPWVFRRNVGIMFSNQKVSCSATFYHLTKEMALGTVHDYLRLRLAVRF